MRPLVAYLILEPERDSPFREIIRSQLHFDSVAWHETDVVFTHTPAHVSNNNMAVLELDSELRPRQGLNDLPSELDHFLLASHKLLVLF